MSTTAAAAGFGRAYRKQLDGRWGVADVEDCVAAARFLAARGDVDPRRLIIRGGSAGGFTVLSALALHDTFTAGASLYGVADLEALAGDTHKFERPLPRLADRPLARGQGVVRGALADQPSRRLRRADDRAAGQRGTASCRRTSHA